MNMTIKLGFILLAGIILHNPEMAIASESIKIYSISRNQTGTPLRQELGKPIRIAFNGPSIPHEGFHARLFRGLVSDLRRYLPDTQGCVRFDTVVLPVSVGGEIKMQSLDDPAWLDPAGDGFKAENYTIVFETGDQPSDSVIRIHANELDNYFRYAISMNLVPPEKLKQSVKRNVDDAKAYLQRRQEAFQSITNSICWGVKLTADLQNTNLIENSKVAELIPCNISSLSFINSIKDQGVDIILKNLVSGILTSKIL